MSNKYETVLPPMPDLADFREPLFAEMVRAYYVDDSLIELHQAMAVAVPRLSDDQLLDTSHLVDELEVAEPHEIWDILMRRICDPVVVPKIINIEAIQQKLLDPIMSEYMAMIVIEHGFDLARFPDGDAEEDDGTMLFYNESIERARKADRLSENNYLRLI